MHVLLIQPPEPPQPVKPLDLAGNHVHLFAPPWDTLCLQAYLRDHTRHMANLADCRLYTNLEQELVEAIRALPEPRVLAINTISHALGQAAAVLAIARRHFPDTTTVLYGEFPSQFPDHVSAITGADYGLAGDPEPILRNLLDYIDIPPRLKRTPGLIFDGGESSEPYWLKQLSGLSVSEWQDVFWGAYRSEAAHDTIRAQVRLSRGHTHLPADRGFGRDNEPLRVWPLDRVAKVIQKCANQGVNEVMLTDPPGFWSPRQVQRWCAELKHIRNRQKWRLQLLPTLLSDANLMDMASAACSGVDFIFPSCDPELLQQYGCILKPEELNATIEAVQSYDMSVRVRFLVGGPEERPGEAERISTTVHALDYANASLHPYPFAMHSPLYAELTKTESVPHLQDWLDWSRDPWTAERPLPLWHGHTSIEAYNKIYTDVQRALGRSPRHFWKKFLNHLQSRNWIRTLEDKALAMMLPHTTPKH
jgi:hypothetical protein